MNQTKRTHEITPEFTALCEANKITPTRRQVRKFANGYGALAMATNKSNRRMPPGPLKTERQQIEAFQEFQADRARAIRTNYARTGIVPISFQMFVSMDKQQSLNRLHREVVSIPTDTQVAYGHGI